MNFFTRLSNGWNIAMNSFTVLKENKKLILFPILSGISMTLILGSFVLAIFSTAAWDVDNIQEPGRLASYLYMFIFYVVNYFVVVFFNTALVHCARLYFNGEEVSVKEGLKFALSRIGVIFSWALLAGTVGTVLRIIQENSGIVGKIINGLIGIVWSIATFFVVPVIAFENAGPITALKRSSSLMKEKWGESIGARFSLGLVNLLGTVLILIPAFLVGIFIHPFAGIVLGLLCILLLASVTSAVKMIFISSVYMNVTGHPVAHLDQQLVDGLFQEK